MLRRMFVWGFVVDTATNRPFVILKETEGERILSLEIGLLEAPIVTNVLKGGKFSRPMPHDLLTNIIGLINTEVNKVEINDLRDNRYYALIHIIHNGKELHLDARPSDALTIAVKMNAPIFAEEYVIQKSKHVELTKEPEVRSEGKEKWKEILENLHPEDFGKYKM